MANLLEEAFALAHQLSERDQYFFARLLLGELLGESNLSGMHGHDVPESPEARPARVAEASRPAYRAAGAPLVIASAADIPDPKELGDPSDEELKDTSALMDEARRHAFALPDDQRETFAAFMHREAISELKWAEAFAMPEAQEWAARMAEEARADVNAGRTWPLRSQDFD